MRALACILLLLTLTACATTRDIPVGARDDICQIFATNAHWRADAQAAEKKWGAPVPVIIAFVRQESNFDGNAKPPRGDGFLFFPGKRPSTAHGYAQALDQTWATYQRDTGHHGADRDDFADASDFVGWYMSQTKRRNGVALTDARNQYLAYHEGWGGYAKRSYTAKPWLLGVADRVAARAARYDAQYTNCRGKRRGLWPF